MFSISGYAQSDRGKSDTKKFYQLLPESELQKWATPLYQQAYQGYDPTAYSAGLQDVIGQLGAYNPYLQQLSQAIAQTGTTASQLYSPSLGYGSLGANFGSTYGQQSADVGRQSAESTGGYTAPMSQLSYGLGNLGSQAEGYGYAGKPMMDYAANQYTDVTGSPTYKNLMGSLSNELGKQLAQSSATASGLGARASSGDILTKSQQTQNMMNVGANLGAQLQNQAGTDWSRFAGTGLSGLGMAGQLYGTGISGLGAAGQLNLGGLGQYLAGLGQGGQLGMAGAQTGLQGVGSALQSQTGAGGLYNQATGPVATSLSSLGMQPDVYNVLAQLQTGLPMQWLAQAYGMTPGAAEREIQNRFHTFSTGAKGSYSYGGMGGGG